MPVVNGELVQEEKTVEEKRNGNSFLSQVRKIGCGPKVPFFMFNCPVVFLALIIVFYGLIEDWNARSLVLFSLQIATVCLLSIVPPRTGYTYSGSQGPSSSQRPRQMSVRDLPAPARAGGG
mmetsp:Transcript_10271/g.15351  ORF Transcript_10271/g.15351 Transcript_10271/m.15351 type:complete len:121 (-) Transcript_10271:265-627(-)